MRFILYDYSFSGKRIKPDLNYSAKYFNFLMRCGLYPLASPFMACKESYNLLMNRASLDQVQ